MIREVFAQWSFRTRLLVATWLLFLLLVALGLHGSSIACTTDLWSLGSADSTYLLSGLKARVSSATEGRDGVVQARSRQVRGDEWMFYTPWALSQLSHNPRFPVINSNFCDGQNMLMIPATPVLHISTLARPATWGYFFLGAQRGLAWQWWFQVFACFTTLFLLFEIVLQGQQLIAAFGSFWFCGSAYVVCWSLWPAYLTFFAALACLSAFHLLNSQKTIVQLLSALLLGLAIPGFAMILYPAWQVPVVYVSLFLFGGLVYRDKLYKALWPPSASRLVSLILAVVVAAGISISVLISAGPALQAMRETVYPGQRVAVGGGLNITLLFRGVYNWRTTYSPAHADAILQNQSEASSFYFMFPAVLAAYAFSRRLRSALGAVGLALLACLVGLLFYAFVGLPENLARATLLSYSNCLRIDLALGLVSILLCSMTLAKTRDLAAESTSQERIPLIAGIVAMVATVVVAGLQTRRQTGWFPSLAIVLVMSLLFGVAGWFMLAGKTRLFMGLMGVLCLVTSAFFNPLASNLDYIYKSEIASRIQSLNSQPGERPLWICYGDNYPSTLVTMLGGRTIGGVLLPPPLLFWRQLDPQGELEDTYNRMNHLLLAYQKNDCPITLDRLGVYVLTLRIAPTNTAFSSRGARYVLAIGGGQSELESTNLHLVAKGANDSFSIFEIMSSPNSTEPSKPPDPPEPCSLTAPPSYQGSLDHADCAEISGWVWDKSHPLRRLTALLYDGDRVIDSVTANILRLDLKRIPFGDGRYGFRFETPGALKDGHTHRLRVAISGSEFELAQRERVFECPSPDG